MVEVAMLFELTVFFTLKFVCGIFSDGIWCIS